MRYRKKVTASLMILFLLVSVGGLVLDIGVMHYVGAVLLVLTAVFKELIWSLLGRK